MMSEKEKKKKSIMSAYLAKGVASIIKLYMNINILTIGGSLL
uniref:Uncharacterized protein n=1 Tax=Anguilla anguilla TaxID=7936 RepID=A0A0E9RRD3_ANGAN